MPEPNETFSMPKELERRPPRPVRRREGTLGCGIVFGRLFILPHVIVGLFLLLVMFPATIAAVFFGEVHDGRVVKTWTTTGKKGSVTYRMKYSYDAGGQERTGDRTVSKTEYQQLSGWSEGQWSGPLKVHTTSVMGHYFDQVVLPDESPWEPVGLSLVMALLWNGIVFIFVYLLWIAPWREKRLYRWGTPVPGRIFGKHTTRGKTTSYYLDYEFVQPGFGLRKKKQGVTSERYYAAREGEMVTVLCYPNRKGPTVVYEYGDFECG